MKKKVKWEMIQMDSHRRIQFWLLLAVCLAETLFIASEGMFHYVGYFLIDDYIAVPALLFLGTALTQKMSGTAKRNLCLSAVAVLWFVLVQIQHRTQDMVPFVPGMFFLSYLMAFPFASVTEDQGKNIGIKLVTILYLVAALVLSGYSILLVLNCQPEYMKTFIYWDGTRLHPLWHPNVSACIFMIGIGSCLSYLFHTRSAWKKGGLIILVTVQFLVMSLTNSRTSLLMTCAMIGGAVFFAIHRAGLKRLLAGVAAALMVTVVLFASAGEIYEKNQERLETHIVEQLQTVQKETLAPQPETAGTQETMDEAVSEQEILVDEKTGDISIQGVSNQGTLRNDMKTLNGRTLIWKASWNALKNNPSVRWWGTEYVDLLISANGELQVSHAHNSWIETLMNLGIPGLLLALVYTGIALWSAAVLLISQSVERWKKMIVILVLCILVAGFLEPYLFFTRNYYHFIDFAFFFCLGYLDLWRRQVWHLENNQKQGRVVSD